ncbi:hypothetical protein HF521_012492, partial [Silurus meridionalis]
KKNWVDLLPTVLAEMRMTPRKDVHLSPHKIIFGRPFPTPWRKGKPAIGTADLDVHIAEYSAALIDTLSKHFELISKSIPVISLTPTHPFRVGVAVLIKSLKPRRLGECKYEGPALIVEITRTCVLTDPFPQWIHATRIKK